MEFLEDVPHTCCLDSFNTDLCSKQRSKTGNISYQFLVGIIFLNTSYKSAVDLDNVEVLAPETSHELDKYNNSNIKVRNFSSHDPNAKKYCIVTSDEANRVKIIFEPSEKMLELAKAKSPRKVIIE